MTELLEAPEEVYTEKQKLDLMELAKLWTEDSNPISRRRYMQAMDIILDKL